MDFMGWSQAESVAWQRLVWFEFLPVCQMQDRGKEGGMRYKNSQQTSKKWSLLITGKKKYENRIMDNNDIKPMFTRTENQGNFLKACVSIN